MADQPVRRDMADDEIDIGALIARLWATKGRAILAMFAVAAVFITILAAQYLRSDKPVTYTQAFNLTFEGLADGEFPDGSPFLISDIISPSVLTRVHTENQLAASDVTLDQFRRALNIEPYAPDYQLIQQRYQQQLSNSKLSTAELADLQERMRSELNKASSSSVLLSLQLPENTITAAQATEVLKDIAQTWADRAIDEKGVLKLDLPIYSARIFDEERFESLDYLVGIELLLSNVELVQENIEALKEQPNAGNVVDPETQYNLEDLQKAIDDVAKYDLRQLIDPVKELGLARDPEFVQLFYKSRLQELRLQKNLWQERARVTQKVLDSYASGSTDSNTTANSNPAGNLTPQLGDAFLDRLLEVSRQGDDLAYRQELTREILRYENEALDVTNEMASIDLTLAALDDAASNGSAVMTQYIQEVQQRLPAVLATLRDHTRVVGRLHDQLGREAIGSTSQLIQPQGGSFREITKPVITGTAIKTLIALMVLTLFATVFFSLIADLMRERRNAGTPSRFQPETVSSDAPDMEAEQGARKIPLRSSAHNG